MVEAVQDRRFDVLLLDMNYARDTTSGGEGLGLLSRIRELDSALPVVLMTAWGSIELAVEAMQSGGGDYFDAIRLGPAAAALCIAVLPARDSLRLS